MSRWAPASTVCWFVALFICLLVFQTDADPEVCKRMCKFNHCENVHSLVSYYQMVRCCICSKHSRCRWPATLWLKRLTLCRSIVCLCGCCCSKCSGPCAAWTLRSSPPSWTPSCPWNWPGTFRRTHRVRTFPLTRPHPRFIKTFSLFRSSEHSVTLPLTV